MRERKSSEGLKLPLLSRSDLDLAETRIKCQILDKQIQDERTRLQDITTDLRSVHTDNDRARNKIKEVNARIQQLELRSLKPDKADLADQDRKRLEQRTRDIAVGKSKLQALCKQLEGTKSEVETVLAAINLGEAKAKGMESGMEQPVSWPSLKTHYLRSLVLHMKHVRVQRQGRAFAQWRLTSD
jgi:DNA repair ATPase RecN